MQTLTLTKPDDWHIHLRDHAYLNRTVPDVCRQFGRAIVMPNLAPAVTTIEAAESYRERILSYRPKDSSFEPLMTLYLTESFTPDLIEAAAQHPHIYACKLYPAGATTHSSQGVKKIAAIYPVLEAMEKYKLPLLVHGEVTDESVDIFDRESQFIDSVLVPMRHEFPALKIVLEHITTKEAVEFIHESPAHIGATITAHHLLYHRNQLLAGGIHPHYYCLPILKRRIHQEALLKAATSGQPQFFLGTDSAPHAVETKESSCGCAGIYTAHAAIELYAEAFAQMNALDKLEAFASFHGADFYGLPRHTEKIQLIQSDWTVPSSLSFGQSTVKPLRANETVHWTLQ